MPGMRRHPRDQKVQVAQTEVRMSLHKLQKQHDLTDIEMLQALAEHLRQMLGNFDTPAGVDTK